MHNFPYIFTFYSYKGGVGRTMGLLNTAYALAGYGRHVLILDMDLEAPGLSDFLSRNDELANKPDKDIIDLLQAVMDFEKQQGKPEDAAGKIGELSGFISCVKHEKLEPLQPKMGQLGRLDVISAAVDRNKYWERLAGLKLETGRQEQQEHQKQLLKYSIILKQYLKDQRFTIKLPGLPEPGRKVQVPYDYILVDSRTGITETGGLCVGPLSDRLVILTSLNEQNIHGTLSMMKLTGITPKKSLGGANKPAWDDAVPDPKDDLSPPLLGLKPTLIIASPVPSGEIDYKRNRLKVLADNLGEIASKFSYHPQMALVESIFVRDYPEEYLALEYNSFVDKLMASATDHAAQLSRISAKLFKEDKDIMGAIKYALRLSPHNSVIGEASLKQLDDIISPSTDTEFESVYQLYALLSQTDQQTAEITFNNWGSALSDHARTKQGAEADRLFKESYGKYEKAVEIKPDFHEAFTNWGTALLDHAKTKQGAKADRLFKESYGKYEKAVKVKPDKHEAFTNWGTALSDHAKTKEGAEADRLFKESYEKHEKALKIKPGNEAVYFNQACWWALNKNEKESIKYLEKITTSGTELAKQIRDDADFARLLNLPAFKSFMEDLENAAGKR